MENKLFKVVNAGKKTKEEIHEMIQNLEYGEILSIQFGADGANEDTESEEPWEYKCD